MRRGTRMAGTLAVAVATLGMVATAEAGVLRGGKAKKNQAVSGQFASTCMFSHRLGDDPIVRPGAPDASHSHDFLGNKSTNAFSTAATLAAGSTSCRRKDDLAAYWVPTLYEAGRAVKPTNATAYYRTGGKVPATIRAFPAGLKLVAGNSAATSPQGRRVVGWRCEGGPMRAKPPLCLRRRLALVVNFPDCWDGFSLDSIDHRSHLTYSGMTRGGRGCPSSHSVPVPALSLHLRYRVRGGGPLVTLASGPSSTAHADFFNTWRQSALEALVQRCLNANVHCAGN